MDAADGPKMGRAMMSTAGTYLEKAILQPHFIVIQQIYFICFMLSGGARKEGRSIFVTIALR